jgi:hypothetical protein
MASKRLARRYPVRNLSSREEVSGLVERLANIPCWTTGFDKVHLRFSKDPARTVSEELLIFQRRFESEAGREGKFSYIPQWRL